MTKRLTFSLFIVYLLCCVSFRCTRKWFNYTYTYIYSFPILFPFRLLQNTEQNSLCNTIGPCWFSVLIQGNTLRYTAWDDLSGFVFVLLESVSSTEKSGFSVGAVRRRGRWPKTWRRKSSWASVLMPGNLFFFPGPSWMQLWVITLKTQDWVWLSPANTQNHKRGIFF